MSRQVQLILIIALALFIPSLSSQAQAIRAFWVDGFNPGFKTKQQVDLLIQRLEEAKCNAVFVQMRKRGDAYYLSRYEPWANDDPDHFDVLAYLIKKAHAANPPIQVHAWINACVVGNPSNPGHVVKLHPDWLSISDTGQTYDGEATKLDPGNPAAADWIARVFLDVVRHYDVDGIHFDFIRYGGPQWGYNPVSVARFDRLYHRTGKPAYNDPLWDHWRREQVTELVRKVYTMVHAIRPNIVVSAATITWENGPTSMEEWRTKSAAMNRVFQNWVKWMKQGILDLNCPMVYYNYQRYPTWWQHWIDFAKDHTYGRELVIGVGNYLNTTHDTKIEIHQALEPTSSGGRANGFLLYSYAGTNTENGKYVQYNPQFYPMIASLGSTVTDPTAMPQPPNSALMGYILVGADLTAADGAQVQLTGPGGSQTLTTDGTGFFAAPHLTPGTYHLTVSSLGCVGATPASDLNSLKLPQDIRLTLTTGHTANRTLLIGDTLAKSNPFKDTGQLTPGSEISMSQLEVVLGSDTSTGDLMVRPVGSFTSFAVHIAAGQLVMPLQPGDLIALTGKVEAATTGGSPAGDPPVINAQNVAFTGAMPTPHVYEVSGPDLGSPLTYGLPVQVEGPITGTTPDGFTINCGTPISILTTDIKNPGVDPAPTPAQPAIGQIVRVNGVVTQSGTDQAAVQPFGFTAIQNISQEAADPIKLQIVLPSGFTLFSFPYTPLDGNPSDLLNNSLKNGELSRWDPIQQKAVIWKSADPQPFGGFADGSGYWYRNFGSQLTVQFNALPPNSHPLERWISLPKAGRSLIGAASHDVSWQLTRVTDGHRVLTLEQAAKTGWLDPVLHTWDTQSKTYRDLKPINGNLLRAGFGYWIRTYRDGLALILSNRQLLDIKVERKSSPRTTARPS